MAKKKARKAIYGMTLIEILIVIAVIGILAVASVFAVSRQLSKANDVKMKSDFSQIRTALFSYYEETGCFPDTLPSCGSRFELEESVFMAKIPCSSDDTNYMYESDGNACSAWFRLVGNLKNTSDKDIDLVGCRNGCGESCTSNYVLSSTNISLRGSCSIPTPTTPNPTTTPTIAPTATPTPPGGPTPTPTGPMYACAPPTPGRCIEYADPGASNCPIIYYNDPTCQNECNRPQNQCRDERGKKN